MTATIAPSSAMAGTARADPELRRQDYLTAFRSYLAMPGAPNAILFCENSGVNLDDFRAAVANANPYGKQVSFLSFESRAPTNRGKGYAELDILDRAFDQFLRSWADEDPAPVIWKVTGRLIVPNFEQMVATAPAHFDLYADFRSVPFIGERLGGNDWVDTRLLAFTPAGYERYLYGFKEQVGWTIEKSIFSRLQPLLARDKAIVPRFRTQPLLDGVCGGSAVDYNGLGSRAKSALRTVSRKVAPGLWL